MSPKPGKLVALRVLSAAERQWLQQFIDTYESRIRMQAFRGNIEASSVVIRLSLYQQSPTETRWTDLTEAVEQYLEKEENRG